MRILEIQMLAGHQVDCIRNGLPFRNGGHTCDLHLEMGKHTALIQTLRLEGRTLIWAIPSSGSLHKDNERKKGSFFTLLPSST